jgi:hypothetical protein
MSGGQFENVAEAETENIDSCVRIVSGRDDYKLFKYWPRWIVGLLRWCSASSNLVVFSFRLDSTRTSKLIVGAGVRSVR